MGAGKTTLGRAVAFASSGWPGGEWEYVDLDELIERHEGMPVNDIFRQKGESEFRRLEVVLLREAAMRENVIIGCGGGTPCHSGNMEWMNAHGVTVLLEASLPVLLRRLLEARLQRPLIAALPVDEVGGFIEAKIRERQPFYSMAKLRFPSDRLETEAEVAEACGAFQKILEYCN